MTRRRAHRVVTAFVLLAALPACTGLGDLRADQLSITAPSSLSTVQVPVTVEWQTQHLPSSVTQYAVFVDRGPMSPGADVRSLVDDGCRRRRGCPDAPYLRTLGIYLTPDLHVSLPSLPTLGGLSAQTAQPVHHVIVVGLDHEGRRVGEFSATSEFRFER
jgi:hypothetical protein